jgi:hypothetical protein
MELFLGFRPLLSCSFSLAESMLTHSPHMRFTLLPSTLISIVRLPKIFGMHPIHMSLHHLRASIILKLLTMAHHRDPMHPHFTHTLKRITILLVDLDSRLIQLDAPFRQNGLFGHTQDLQAQYGGLFYSAASSSHMVGMTPLSPTFASSIPPSSKALEGESQAWTAPMTPSRHVYARALSENGGNYNDSSAFLSSFPVVPGQNESRLNASRLHGSSSPCPTSPSSHSRCDDTYSSSSIHSSPLMTPETKSVDIGVAPWQLWSQSSAQPSNLKTASNRLFGNHPSYVMHDDSDSPFTTDISSSEDESSSFR